MKQYASKNTYDAIQWRGNNKQEIVEFFNDPYYGYAVIKNIPFAGDDGLAITFYGYQKKVVGSNMWKTHWLYIDSWFVICKNTAYIEILDNEDFCNSYKEIGV